MVLAKPADKDYANFEMPLELYIIRAYTFTLMLGMTELSIVLYDWSSYT